MIEIDLRADLQPLLGRLQNLQREIPYAVSNAINGTLFVVRKSSQQQLETAFDRPTRLVTGATRVEKATKQTLIGRVHIDQKRVPVIVTHETGGTRGLQGLEQLLRGKGLLPSGYKAIPSHSMPLDAHGNPEKAVVKPIKKWLSGDMGRTSRNRRYFVIPVGTASMLPPGVWLEASGSSGAGTGRYRVNRIVPLFLFFSGIEYRSMLGWGEMAKTSALKIIPIEIEKSITRVLETTD